MGALDLLDDRAPDAAHRDPAALRGGDGGADVRLGDAPARAGAGHGREIDPELSGEPVKRECLERLRADNGDDRLRQRRRLGGRIGNRTKQLLAARADHREGCADSGQLPFAGDDAEHGAGDRCTDLDGRLVGVNLDDRLVLDDLVALSHEPAGDLPLSRSLAQIRQRERVRHGSSVVGRLRAGDGRGGR